MNAVKYKLGTLVKYHRNKNNISQIELANKVNVTQSLISKIETGNKNINIEKYILVLNYFDIYYKVDHYEESIVNALIEKLNRVYESRQVAHLHPLLSEVKDIDDNTFNVLLQYRLKLYHIQSMILFENLDSFLNEFYKILDLEALFNGFDLIIYYRLKTFYYLHIGKRELGMEYYKKVEIESELQGYSSFLNKYLGTIVYYYNNNVLEATLHLLKAEELCKKTGYTIRLMQIYELFGLIFYYEGQLEESKVYFFQVEAQMNKVDYKQYNQITAYCLALISMEEKKYHDAILRLKNSIIYCDNHFFSISLYTLIKCYHLVGDEEKVVELYKNMKDNFNQEKYNLPLIKAMIMKEEVQSDEYYKYIESILLPKLKDKRSWSIYFDISLDLMSYYWDTRQYRKYKTITDEILVIKRSLDINYEG